MADKVWTQSVTGLMVGAGDQVLIDNVSNGALSQVIVGGSSLLAGIIGRLALKRHPKVQHVTDGLLVTGAALVGQSGAHYVDNSLLANAANNTSGSGSGSGASSTGTGTSTSTAGSSTATNTAAQTVSVSDPSYESVG